MLTVGPEALLRTAWGWPL